ncbi:MAG TPA: membrane protein FxsA, partial [Methylococcaceae bacterium]|nr:membrane protein FxsA [Methylococcaceae bacterium]
MPFPLKITLIVFPFVELALLAQIAAASGFFPTLGLLLIAASIGAAIIRLRGLSVLIHMQRSARSGQLPAREMLNDGISAVG